MICSFHPPVFCDVGRAMNSSQPLFLGGVFMFSGKTKHSLPVTINLWVFFGS